MRFLTADEIIEINKIAIVENGGMLGIKDKNLLESAIVNPKNLYHYQNLILNSFLILP